VRETTGDYVLLADDGREKMSNDPKELLRECREWLTEPDLKSDEATNLIARIDAFLAAPPSDTRSAEEVREAIINAIDDYNWVDDHTVQSPTEHQAKIASIIRALDIGKK
jgi:chemotaxis regulatin CheY-phosphate phosphatase CheZ